MKMCQLANTMPRKALMIIALTIGCAPVSGDSHSRSQMDQDDASVMHRAFRARLRRRRLSLFGWGAKNSNKSRRATVSYSPPGKALIYGISWSRNYNKRGERAFKFLANKIVPYFEQEGIHHFVLTNDNKIIPRLDISDGPENKYELLCKAIKQKCSGQFSNWSKIKVQYNGQKFYAFCNKKGTSTTKETIESLALALHKYFCSQQIRLPIGTSGAELPKTTKLTDFNAKEEKMLRKRIEKLITKDHNKKEYDRLKLLQGQGVECDWDDQSSLVTNISYPEQWLGLSFLKDPNHNELYEKLRRTADSSTDTESVIKSIVEIMFGKELDNLEIADFDRTLPILKRGYDSGIIAGLSLVRNGKADLRFFNCDTQAEADTILGRVNNLETNKKEQFYQVRAEISKLSTKWMTAAKTGPCSEFRSFPSNTNVKKTILKRFAMLKVGGGSIEGLYPEVRELFQNDIKY